MQFFYIDYINNGKKERNIGFLRIENDGVSVGLRGVPLQCGNSCRVYAVNEYDERILMGEIAVRNGYSMEKLKWNDKVDFVHCMKIEIPLYGSRKGICVLRDDAPQMHSLKQPADLQQNPHSAAGMEDAPSRDTATVAEYNKNDAVKERNNSSECHDIYEEIHEDKWKQLMNIYPQVHICPEAQSIVIRPKDAVILTQQYHELATNSFVLHAYYNYRQLLLFRYAGDGAAKKDIKYYLGVPGVYYEREQRIAQMFGFEGFENGEARMQQDADNKVYRGCFGYYMKRVEI
ncbi:MAG: hypothetical protein K2N73_07640 [Lachnospiraceae bacterium]|nr:hypothetical protein [Lachnospiraceae bacterium]